MPSKIRNALFLSVCDYSTTNSPSTMNYKSKQTECENTLETQTNGAALNTVYDAQATVDSNTAECTFSESLSHSQNKNIVKFGSKSVS